MKTIFIISLLFEALHLTAQPINKAWIDNQAKQVNSSFEPVNAQYYINNVQCSMDEINQLVRQWSASSVISIDVLNTDKELESYFPAYRSLWIVKLSGSADPSLKKTSFPAPLEKRKKKSLVLTGAKFRQPVMDSISGWEI